VLAALVGKYMRGQLKPRAASNGGHAPVGGDIDEGDEAIRTFVAKVLAQPAVALFVALVREKRSIGSVWENVKNDASMARLGESGFKERLLEAHRLGALTLSR